MIRLGKMRQFRSRSVNALVLSAVLIAAVGCAHRATRPDRADGIVMDLKPITTAQDRYGIVRLVNKSSHAFEYYWLGRPLAILEARYGFHWRVVPIGPDCGTGTEVRQLLAGETVQFEISLDTSIDLTRTVDVRLRLFDSDNKRATYSNIVTLPPFRPAWMNSLHQGSPAPPNYVLAADPVAPLQYRTVLRSRGAPGRLKNGR